MDLVCVQIERKRVNNRKEENKLHKPNGMAIENLEKWSFIVFGHISVECNTINVI